MRIISGIYKHVRINPPKNLPVRPTTDKTKESVFNILSSYIDFENVHALDLFAGTGNMTFEFLSRGCREVTAVEEHPKAVNFMRKLAANYRINNVKVFKTDVFRFIEKNNERYDIIFADPPYDMERIDYVPEAIIDSELLSDNGWMLIEHAKDTDLSSLNYFYEVRKYGRTRISVFRK